MKIDKIRCFGNKLNQKLYADYHDNEWGKPIYDDLTLFELLILEGAQAGLSWEIILNRRIEYRKAFHNFDVNKVSSMSDLELDSIIYNSGVIRNRSKIYSARNNAIIFISIQKEFGSFKNYIWNFSKNKIIKNNWTNLKEIPCETPLSKLISFDLKSRGMKFIGPKIIYSYMQAIGMVNDHIAECWLSNKENL